MNSSEKKLVKSLQLKTTDQSDDKLKLEFRQGICAEKYNQKLIDKYYHEVIEKILAQLTGKDIHAC